MGDQEYGIQLVDDDALPPGQDWVIIRAGDCYVAIVKRSAWCPATVREAWEGWSLIAAPPALRWAV